MKIAYLTNQYPHVRHTFIRREIQALEERGVTVLRFSIRDTSNELVDEADRAESTRTRSLIRAGVAALASAALRSLLCRPWRFALALATAWRLGGRSERGRLRHLVYLLEACLLRRWLEQSGVEHLHVHFATNPAAVALLCRRLGGPPYSITVHGPEEWDRPEALSLREKYENARFVAAVTDYGRCQVYRWTPVSVWPRVTVIRCGLSDDYWSCDPDPVPNTRRLVLVAGLVEQKGHLLLLQSLARVREAGLDFQMIFVGDGPLRPLLEREVARLALDRQVTFAGWQSNAQVQEHLRQARGLVMPSFAENLPVAMMEALALGRPVIGTYIAGIPELIENNIHGWLVPAGNMQAAADAIQRLLTTPVDVLTRMGQAGRERVRQLHDVRREAARLHAWLVNPEAPESSPGQSQT